MRKTHTTLYYPQSNRKCRRFNRTLMFKELKKQSRWTHYLAIVIWKYNHAVHDDKVAHITMLYLATP